MHSPKRLLQQNQNNMRKFFNTVWSFFEAYGTARAATELTRLGLWREARFLLGGK
jgi:hypothetical protein